jgi:formate dehydrogenase maturation protein FdhE
VGLDASFTLARRPVLTVTRPILARRRARIAKLGAEHQLAVELLTFYDRVIELQEAVACETDRFDWLNNGATGATLSLDRLPLDRCVPPFQRFAGDVGAASTDVLVAVSESLVGSTSIATDVLGAFVSRRPLDEIAATLGHPPSSVEFFPRAFMQPLAEKLVAMLPATEALPVSIESDERHGQNSGVCPRCGWLPQLALLRDGIEVKGERVLLCALCSTEWVFTRATCPHCRSTETDKLVYHVTDAWPHVRVEECQICHTYLKAIDLRSDGLAVPLVDELASVELDIWAGEAGLEKLQRNLLGL